ncbi:Uncharacterised protein [Neisseria meningitidis]|nr:Uncharacterised protein [Neisseria meningitidis]CWN55592.1 Uncharacterised protein [Neisseria meningitidis]CWN61631.1 Uncharacterised protein [Neisseria meningitidis]CWP27245.1 Uncharacterised protein [Neisseria meningitidis]CWQ69252.1 Uncharacterised protein [Neisseria meningitidis]
MARVRLTTIGLSAFLRDSVKVIFVPGLPRIFFTASLTVMPRVETLSIFTMKSPLFTPARSAGVSSIGETTLTNPSSCPISIPKPPNSPLVDSFISA